MFLVKRGVPGPDHHLGDVFLEILFRRRKKKKLLVNF